MTTGRLTNCGDSAVTQVVWLAKHSAGIDHRIRQLNPLAPLRIPDQNPKRKIPALGAAINVECHRIFPLAESNAMMFCPLCVNKRFPAVVRICESPPPPGHS